MTLNSRTRGLALATAIALAPLPTLAGSSLPNSARQRRRDLLLPRLPQSFHCTLWLILHSVEAGRSQV